MIESIEGKRGEPRMRPPYIAQVGLFGRPTLEHNFETLYWVRDIVEKGPQWFSGFGRHGRKGLRSFSVSGRVKHPGVKLAPAGITVQRADRRILRRHAGRPHAHAYLPGGASGGILPASMDDIPLDFDTLQPHGCFIGSAAVMVLSQHDRARDAALNMMRFFEHESCGQCTPCRVGTAKAAALMQAPVWDNATLEDLAQVMGDASICGLGQAAPNPIRCIQKYFPQEIAMNAPTTLGRTDAADDRVPARRPHRRGPRGRNHPPGRATRTASTSRTFATRRACGPTATAAPAWSEIKGERTLAPSCCRAATAGMEVQACSERALKSQKMVVEMLLSDMPDQGYKWNDAAMRRSGVAKTGQHGELSAWAERKLGIDVRPELKALRREQPPPDISHPAMAVNLDACIQCNRCVRACREEQVNDVIGYAMRGSRIARSCSTWTTRWATAPAWPAANACRPARPAR